MYHVLLDEGISFSEWLRRQIEEYLLAQEKGTKKAKKKKEAKEMGVYKRGDTWCISYFVNGKRKREAIGKVKRTAEEVLENKK